MRRGRTRAKTRLMTTKPPPPASPEKGAPGAAAEKSAAPAPPSKFKRFLVRAGVALGFVAAAYGTGRLQGRSATSEAERATQDARAETASAKHDTEAARALIARLEARRRLDRALREIDRRNFGIAADELRDGAALLEASRPDGELGKLATDWKAYRLIASDDVAKQRGEVLAFADRFDGLVPPKKP